MTARLAADLIVILHGAFVLFAVLGGLLVLRYRWWGWLHGPAFLWAGFIELSGGICPLTPLENRLRALGGEETYGGGFIEHTLLPVLYPDDLTRSIQIALGLFVLLLNAALYGLAWHRFRREQRQD
ncbi:MAG: DUF2784 domain-containing protein [Deltaproteobacteria bacterium]|nr:DUF2784 domain-containing protein [Deltaproteobacteria bacterium]